MLAKVMHGVKRRRPKDSSEESQSQPRYSDQGEELPPILSRWSDFKDPFPVLSPGAYRKYYMVYGSATTDDLPSRKPLLSSTFELPSPTATPEKSALFTHKAPILPQRLAIIHEASMETMHVERIEPPFECSPPNSLRRRRRQVLRTPSVERDFASIARLVFTHPSSEDINLMDDSHEPFESVTSHSSCETSSTTTHNSHSTVSAIADTPLSPISRTTSQSSDSSDSSDSDHSDTSPSDLVITPLTSVSDVHEDREGHPQKEVIHAFDPHERPDSWCSFSTAKSDFCDI